MKIVGVTGLGGLWALKWVANFFLGQSKGFGRSIKTVGVKVLGGLWALEWAWHIAETNLHCARSSGICTSNLNSLGLVVSEISAFIRSDRRTDGKTDRRTWLDRLG